MRRGSGAAAPVRSAMPVSVFGSLDATLPPITLTFRIDAQGRPLGIAQERIADYQPGRIHYPSSDVVPAFAVSRFAPAAQINCRITFTPRAFATDEAPLPLVRRYIVAPHQRQANELALFRRLHPADSDCIGIGDPNLRLRAFPAFGTIPIEPGGWAYAMTSFDIDAEGKPIRVRIDGSDGNAALDRASIDAVKRSRYAREARKGCTYPYYRRSDATVAAPTSPDKASFAPAGARCEGETPWKTMPKLRFPPGFVERRTEGWAVIGYDIAPWGQTGNVRVLAAEPAAAFGETARDIVSSALQAPSATGRSGCVDIVRFVMPRKGQQVSEE